MHKPSDIAAEIRQSLNLNTQFRQIWEVCIEFLRGNQEPGIAVSGVTTTGAQIANRVWQPENIIINKILPLRNTVASRLATAYPSMTVMPASDSLDDQMKMKASELLLRYFWNENNLKRKLKRGTQWLTDTGNFWFHEHYDEVSGDVNVELVTPFDAICEPYISDIKDAEWIGIRRFTTKEALDARFPDQIKQIAENGASSRDPTSYRQIGPNAKPRDRVEVWEVYTVDGRHMMLLGDYVLWEGRTTTSKIPIQHVRYSEISGYLQGVGLVEVCLSSQIMRNRFNTQIMKNAYLIGNPKILRPTEAGVEPGAFTSDAGEIIDYTGGHAPNYMQAPPLPDYLVSLPARLDADMGDAASQHAISLGKISGAKSGVAIDALTANDLSPLQLVQDNIEEAVQDMAVCVLELMKAHYSEGKMVRMLDTDGQFVFLELKQTDLADNPQVFLEAGSLFRAEAQDRDQKTLEMLKAQLITPDQAKRALSTHSVTNDMVDSMKKIRRAKDLLEAVVKFKRPLQDVRPFDDLDSLLDVFNDFLHSPAVYRLPLAVQDLVDDAVAKITQMKMQKQMAEQGQMPQPQLPQQKDDQGARNDMVANGLPPPPPMPGGDPALSVQAQEAAQQQFMPGAAPMPK